MGTSSTLEFNHTLTYYSDVWAEICDTEGKTTEVIAAIQTPSRDFITCLLSITHNKKKHG